MKWHIKKYTSFVTVHKENVQTLAAEPLGNPSCTSHAKRHPKREWLEFQVFTALNSAEYIGYGSLKGGVLLTFFGPHAEPHAQKLGRKDAQDGLSTSSEGKHHTTRKPIDHLIYQQG